MRAPGDKQPARQDASFSRVLSLVAAVRRNKSSQETSRSLRPIRPSSRARRDSTDRRGGSQNQGIFHRGEAVLCLILCRDPYQRQWRPRVLRSIEVGTGRRRGRRGGDADTAVFAVSKASLTGDPICHRSRAAKGIGRGKPSRGFLFHCDSYSRQPLRSWQFG